jgi:D-alanyl-D-alanine carboxypeptidase/D-alanyl-D-alanine-endopeptidase (penicillin-binding protein 4)
MGRHLSRMMTIVLLAAASARADLQQDVRKAIGEAKLKNASIGVQIVKLGQAPELDQPLVSIEADKPLIPASNLKLITTAAAIDTLGVDFEFRTQLLTREGDVAIIGDGDPMFGDSVGLTGTDWGTTTVFDSWADRLKELKITSVKDVIIDDSIFEELSFHPRWPVDQAHLEYVPQVSGMNLNANCLDVYAIRNADGTATYRIDPPTKYVKMENQISVGSTHSLFLSRVLGGNRIILKGTINGTNRAPFRVTIHDPSMYAATVFAETLRRKGIEVTGEVKRERSIRSSLENATMPAGWTPVAINCTPLERILARTNKESINLYAESIGKRLAAKMLGAPGTWETVPKALTAFVTKAGAKGGTATFDDGCGLSKQNFVSPSAFCSTLAYMFHGANREAYLSTLSVGGVDGTLSKRFREGLAGRVFAKSGYVTGVSTLSGYLKTETGEWFAFSVLTNNISSAGEAKNLQDAIVRAIDANAD